MKVLEQKLKENYESLTGGQKKVAKIIFENPNLIAFITAEVIGEQVGVSESTVIRLAQKLGLRGYSELQEMIRKEIKSGRTLTQYQEIRNISKGKSFVEELMQEDMNNIQRAKELLEEQKIYDAVKLMSDASRIIITGGLASYGLAYFMAHWMDTVFRNTELLDRDGKNYYTQLSKVDADTLVIAIIFPRYKQDTLEFIRYAKKKGARVLAITDSDLSPVYPYADLVLATPVNTKINIDSYTAPLSIITALMRYVSTLNSDRVETNLKEIESVYQECNVFYQDK